MDCLYCHLQAHSDSSFKPSASNRRHQLGPGICIGDDLWLRSDKECSGIDLQVGADSISPSKNLTPPLSSFDQHLNASTESQYSRSRSSMISKNRPWISSLTLSTPVLDQSWTISSHIGRVLIVDDDFAACIMLRRMLTAMNFSCDVAMDGAEAVKAAKNEFFQLIITDVLMPVMNGWDASIEILSQHTAPPLPSMLQPACDSSAQCATPDRVQPSPPGSPSSASPPRLPIVVGVLSHDDAGMRRRCADSGMAAVLVKPVDRAVSGRPRALPPCRAGSAGS